LKILIAGAHGQLGRALRAALRGHDVEALGRDQLDITRADEVLRAVRASACALVVNAAAYNAVDRAEAEPAAAFATNEAGPRTLAEATAGCGAALLHFSSDYVFDGGSREPYAEDARPNPLSVYGKSKLAGERAIRSVNPRHYIVRTAWLYSEHGHNFPLTMIGAAKRGPLRVVDDQHGSPTYAPHLAAAVRRLIDAGAPFGLYHMAGAGGTTWYGLARALFRRLRIDVALEPVTTAEYPRPAPRPAYAVLTTTREPNFPLPSWETGLDEFVGRYRVGRDESG
jgi:dTDP-4-dehydrorhamnose reductase